MSYNSRQIESCFWNSLQVLHPLQVVTRAERVDYFWTRQDGRYGNIAVVQRFCGQEFQVTRDGFYKVWEEIHAFQQKLYCCLNDDSIIEHEQHGTQRASYGKKTIKELSQKLTTEAEPI